MLRTRPFVHLSPLPCAHRYALCNPRITCASQHRLLRAQPCTHSLPNPHTSPPHRATCPIAASHALVPCGTATPLAIRPHCPSRALSDPRIACASLHRMLRARPFARPSPPPARPPPCATQPTHYLRIPAPSASCTAVYARPSPLPRTPVPCVSRRARHLSALRMPPRRKKGKSMRFKSNRDYRLKTGQVRHAIYQALFKQADSI